MSNRSLARLAALVALLLPGSAAAGFAETLGFGARETALGGAATTLVEGPSAWYYNPAGLARIPGDAWDAGIQMTLPGLEQSGSGGSSDERTPTTYRIQAPGALQSGIEGLVLGLGGGATWARQVEWNQNRGDLRFSGYETNLTLHALAPSIGYRVGDSGFHVGATLNVGALRSFEQRQKLGDGFVTELAVAAIGLDIPLVRNAVDTSNGLDDGKIELSTDEEFPTGLSPTNDLDLDFQSVGFHLGILYHKEDVPFSFGLTYRSEMPVDYEGTASVEFADDVKALLNSNAFVRNAFGGEFTDERTRFDHRITFPRQLQWGVGWSPSEWLDLAVDATWTNWSGAWSQQRIRFRGDGLLGEKTREIRREFRDTVAIRVGGEYRATADISVQAGFWWDPSPVPKQTIDSSTLDTTRLIYSLGMTYRDFLFRGAGLEAFEGLDLGFVTQIIQNRKRDIDPGQSVNLGGTQEPDSTVNDFSLEVSGVDLSFGLNLGYRF